MTNLLTDKKEYICQFEDIELGKRYAITINFPKHYQGSANIKTAYHVQLKELFTLYSFKDFHLILYPELSKIGKLHFHGWIMFTTYMEVVQTYHKLFNKCHFNIAKNFKEKDYEIKASRIMKEVCKHLKQPYKINYNNIHKYINDYKKDLA